MDTTTRAPADVVYEDDFHAWCTQQAARLRGRARPGANDGLDYENLAEEIETLGRSDRRAIKSQLRLLLAHLLKWRYQPERRGASWEDTIFNARIAIADLLKESPSLGAFTREAIGETYPLSLRDAASETGLSKRALPDACPFTHDEVFDQDFLPQNESPSTE